MDRKKLLKFFLVFFSVSTILFGAYYFGKKQAQRESIDQAKMVEKSNESELKTSISEPVESEGVTADLPKPEEILKKGDISWQEPQDIGDLGLADEKFYRGCKEGECGMEYYFSNGIKYIKSGQVTEGKYAGYDFLVISSGVAEGPMITPIIFRALRKASDIVFIIDPRYSQDQYLQTLIRDVFSAGGKKEFKNISVEELDFRQELYGTDDRQRFQMDAYTTGFFDGTNLKKVFIHKTYGDVWMTDPQKAGNESKFELNSYISPYDNAKIYKNIFNRQGFYIRAADGTTATYKMKMDIFEGEDERYSVLQATWNDKSRNSTAYEKNPSGCGSGNYVYDETVEVDIEKDLVKVGMTDKGDILYGYRDASSDGFKKLYEEIYWVKNGEQKMSPEEFLKAHPKVFWQDYFGRLLAFYSSEIISPAECGKPVIYLYPQEEAEISVKVDPGKGLSFTEPLYDNGWQILAKPDGQLTNISDGKNYPYLFWEGSSDIFYETPEYGFSVASRDLDSFLNDKLSKLGLIEKEIADFKEFWIPKMTESEKPYFFVTFLSKHYVDLMAPLKVDPKPDTTIRVMMDYQPLDKPVAVPAIPIKTPQRKGFTVVEWGGMLK